jgi:hypothetical protein
MRQRDSWVIINAPDQPGAGLCDMFPVPLPGFPNNRFDGSVMAV